jgi:hypothetical protein
MNHKEFEFDLFQLNEPKKLKKQNSKMYTNRIKNIIFSIGHQMEEAAPL